MAIEHKVLLIEPPFCRLYEGSQSLCLYPLSLGYLAGTIRKETDWDVTVYNADFSPENKPYEVSYMTGIGFQNYLKNLRDLSGPVWEEVRSTIAESRPAVIGITSKSQNFRSSCIIAKLAKEIDSNILVVVGGPHSSMAGKDVLRDPNIDVSVRGEGERTLVELLDAIKQGRDFSGINGILYRHGSHIIENPPREYIEDLDSLCFPHQYAPEVLKDFDQYPKSAFRAIFATRGCPYNCFFCGSKNIWSRRVRYRSATSVSDEIKSLQRMGLGHIHFADDTFGVNKEHIHRICNSLIQNCPGLKWGCEIHANLVDERLIALMKKAGCVAVNVGIESGNNQMLKKIRKTITVEKAISATNVIHDQGLDVSAFFMVGFPEETEETLSDTMKAMGKINGHLIYSIFTPYPGTEAFQFCEEKGLIDGDYDVSLYNHQSPENCFCVNLTKQRFRTIVSMMEIFVDRRNKNRALKEMLSVQKIAGYIKDHGMVHSIKKFVSNVS